MIQCPKSLSIFTWYHADTFYNDHNIHNTARYQVMTTKDISIENNNSYDNSNVHGLENRLSYKGKLWFSPMLQNHLVLLVLLHTRLYHIQTTSHTMVMLHHFKHTYLVSMVTASSTYLHLNSGPNDNPKRVQYKEMKQLSDARKPLPYQASQELTIICLLQWELLIYL